MGKSSQHGTSLTGDSEHGFEPPFFVFVLAGFAFIASARAGVVLFIQH